MSFCKMKRIFSNIKLNEIVQKLLFLGAKRPRSCESDGSLRGTFSKHLEPNKGCKSYCELNFKLYSADWALYEIS